MTWIVFGSSGLFGFDMTKTLIEEGEQVLTLNRSDIDLLWNSSRLTNKITELATSPVTTIVNAIAYTNVDKAENDEATAKLVNCDFAGKLAEVSKELAARLVHISTDFIFDGNSTIPYKPEDPPNPVNVYGKTKLAGEMLIRESDANFQIFRTSWLYGENRDCFPKKIREKIMENKAIKVVDDQIGNPTWTKDLARLVVDHSQFPASLRPKFVHAVASGQTSRFEFAVEIANSLGLQGDSVVKRITSSQDLSEAVRPKFTSLDNRDLTGLQIGNWKERWRVAAQLILADDVK